MRPHPRQFSFCLLLALTFASLPGLAAVQYVYDPPELPRSRFRSGEEVLRALAPVSAATRFSIVKFNVDGETVALGAVVEAGGLVVTKASELKKGKLTCWLASDREVPAEVVAVDEHEDVALVRVRDAGLKPIQWAPEEVVLGEWAVTPGISDTPHAVGIVSSRPRKIRPPRAYLGIRFGAGDSAPRIDDLMPGFGAEKAGLKAGDLILAVNHLTVTNRDQLIDMVRDFRDGQTVQVRVRRGEKQMDAEVRLKAAGPGDDESASYRQQRLSRMSGSLSARAEDFEQAIQHDTVLQPWLCGGPLVNLDGKAIGLNIARAGRVATYALPAKLVQQIVKDLKSQPHS